jgi:hypothetical protein
MKEFQSEQLNELGLALAKAQGEMLIAGKDHKNPFFKSNYADFATIVRASRPSLTKHGLSVVQRVFTTEQGIEMLHTMLLHASGQYIESRVRIAPVKQDAQSLGSCITYLKRYCYAAIVGVTAADEDDDGEAASSHGKDVVRPAPAPKHFNEPISLDQLTELEYALKDHPDICEQVLTGLKIQSLADMPKSKYRSSLDRIQEIKSKK